MKVTLTSRHKWILVAGLAVLLTARPSFALFGIGDIVFDPTSYASLVSQLTTLQTQYTMLKNNINAIIGVKGHHMVVGKMDLEADDIWNLFVNTKVKYSPYSIRC